MNESTTLDQRPQLDPERMRLAREYAHERRRLRLIGLALDALYFAFWWLWAHERLLARLDAGSLGFDARALIYIGLFALGGLMVSLPLRAYRHARSVHYGLSVQTWRAWAMDLLKGIMVTVIIGAPLVWAFYRLLLTFPETWWLWAGLLFLLVAVVLAELAPVLIMPLFLKFTPYEDESLTPRLRALAEEAGARVRGVFRTNLSSKTTAANAWLSGLGRTRRIVLGDTLLNEYSEDEILAVFAHELGHHVHKDLIRGLVVGGAVNMAGFWLAGRVLAWAVTRFGYAGPADLRAFPWLVLALTLFNLITGPLLNAYTRAREWAADRYAYHHGPGASALATAFIRLANQNLADPEPPRWEVLWSYSHPPILARIRAAEQAAGGE